LRVKARAWGSLSGAVGAMLVLIPTILLIYLSK